MNKLEVFRLLLIWVALAPGMILAAACATARPSESPEAGFDLPEAWAAPAPEIAAPEEAEESAPWWTTFDDPHLDVLIQTALAKNQSLKVAAARVEAAAAQTRIAGAPLLPHLDASTTDTRRRQNFIGFPIPGAERRVLSTTSTLLGVALNVSWEADLWGRLRAGKGAALAEAQGAEAELAGARLSLAGQTAKAWFAVLETARQVELAREVTASRRLVREGIERRYRLGLRPALDLHLARTSEATAESLLALRERQLEAAKRQLQILLHHYPDGRLPVGEALPGLPEVPPPIPRGLPATLLARRPDLAASELRLAAAGFRIQEARAALYPQLRLTGSAGRTGQELEDLLATDFSVWSLAAGLLAPVFQGGRLRAGVDLAEARHREAMARHLEILLQAFAEVEGALLREEQLAAEEGALEVAARESEAARLLALERYQAGLVDSLTLLESETRALEARSQLLQARRLRLENRVDLHLALGGDAGQKPSQASADAGPEVHTSNGGLLP